MLTFSVFGILRAISFYKSGKQQQVIIYNAAGRLAMDIVAGRNTVYFGDPEVITTKQSFNFNIKPARVISRLRPVDSMDGLHISRNIIDFRGLHILIAGHSMNYKPPANKQTIDILVVSGNPRLFISKLNNILHFKQVIFLGTAPAYKLKYWKQDCDSLNIPYHELNVKGAFVLKSW